MGNYDTRGVGDGTWAVFAEKVVAERDEARVEVARLTETIDELRRKLAGEAAHIASLEALLIEVSRERDEARAEAHDREVAALRSEAERDEMAAKHNALVVDILEHLPPHVFDDDGPDDEASEREVIAHAGDEIRRLRARAERAESERDWARSEIEMLRGVGCDEDGDGPCEACIKCARRERDELAAELERARAALGPAWLVGGVSLADGIRRKTRVLERFER
jgi:hypothetical protein